MANPLDFLESRLGMVSAWRNSMTGKRPPQGIGWLRMLSEHFERHAWLNPEPVRFWEGNTIEVVRRVFPMFPLTLEGLGEAVDHLTRGRSRVR